MARKRVVLRLMSKLLRSKFHMHVLRARNKNLIQAMNQASLKFLDELREHSKCQKEKINASTQTDHVHVSSELQEIARQRDLIAFLTREVQVSNQRRFMAEEMLHRNNYPKVDAVLKGLGR